MFARELAEEGEMCVGVSVCVYVFIKHPSAPYRCVSNIAT